MSGKNGQKSPVRSTERRAIPRYLSVLQLSQITGKDRKGITEKLLTIKPHSDEGNARLYDSQEALAAIYEVPPSARESLDRMKMEEIQLNMAIKKREYVLVDEMNQSFDGWARRFKAAVDRVRMSEEEREALYREIREGPTA